MSQTILRQLIENATLGNDVRFTAPDEQTQHIMHGVVVAVGREVELEPPGLQTGDLVIFEDRSSTGLLQELRGRTPFKMRTFSDIFEEAESDRPSSDSRWRIATLGVVLTLLTWFTIASAAVSFGGFIVENVAIGVGALGPALAGIVAVTGLQWRVIQHCSQPHEAR